jgi:hypothetical protein
VDHVDATGRPLAIKTLRIDPQVVDLDGNRPALGQFLRRSPELIDYLQCNATLSAGAPGGSLVRLCADLIKG